MKNILKLPLYITVLFPLLLLLGSAVADIGMSAVAILFLVRSYIEKDWAWTKEAWVRCLFMLWLYMLARGAFAQNPYDALRRSLPFVRYFVFAATLAFWTLRDDRTLKYFLMVLTATVLFLTGDGILQWFAGKDIFLRAVDNNHGHIRLTGPFRAPILGITLVWLSFPVCMRHVMDGQGRLRPGYGAFAIPLILVAIVLSGERMALLLVLFGWFLALCAMQLKRVYVLGMVAAGMALVTAITFASPELFTREVLSTRDVLLHWDKSPYGELLKSDIGVARVNPVFGVGSNHFRIVCKELYSDPNACNIHPHNIYMEWLIEQGAIGFSLFIAFIGLLAGKCVRHWSRLRTNPVFIGLAIALVMRLWPFMSTTGFFSRWGAPPFWLITGVYLLYITRIESNPEKDI